MVRKTTKKTNQTLKFGEFFVDTWQKSPAKIEQKIERKNKKGTWSTRRAHDGKALRSKANPSKWKGFAKQSQPIMMERLCEAKPIDHDGKALRSKANPAKWKGFAKQSQLITSRRVCEAKPIKQNWKALRSKANPSQRKCFAKQSLSIKMDGLCEANPIHH